MNEMIRSYLDRTGMTEEEYDERRRPWKAEYDRLETIASDALSHLPGTSASLKAAEARREACAGGDLHRGFYCPSMIQDIVISGINRGKLCDPADKAAAFTYSFDAQNRLIGVHTGDTMEYIRWEGNISTGAIFDSHGVSAVCECKYDEQGRILRYSFLLHGSCCIHEVYTYEDGAMAVDLIGYHDSSALLTEDRWRFTVEDGMLKDCIAEICSGADLRSTPVEDRTVPVKIVRRI